MPDLPFEDSLRLLTMNDERFLSAHMMLDDEPRSDDGLDPKTCALVRMAALIATDASSTSCHWAASRALDTGATPQEIVDVLLAIAPMIGIARVVAAAPDVAHGIGYDIDRALEALDEG
jgi:alkylhydroperoxidase/carboxymuconolactone decarboxylase family protein YurZ